MTAVLSNATSVTPSTSPTASSRWFALSGARAGADVDTRTSSSTVLPMSRRWSSASSDRASRHGGQRPGAAALEGERQIEQPMLVEVAPGDLQAHGQRAPVGGNETGRNRHGR